MPRLPQARQPAPSAAAAPSRGSPTARPAAPALAGAFLALLALPPELLAQAALTGRVRDVERAAGVEGAAVRIEGTDLVALSDSAGRYRLVRVPLGPQTVVASRIGYAESRVSVTVPAAGVLVVDLDLAASALRVEGVTVTADPVGRARGELGTASIIDRTAIEVQSATSLSGILELVPGIELRPPGLGEVEQVALRTSPVSSVTSLTLGGPSAADLASLGTLIVLDGVPVSNNANLQTTGPRGEVRFPSSAGGGVDLRRIPAATLERVEVIRGISSARYGDLTQGVIVVDTRAGAFEPRARAIFDPNTGGGVFLGGWAVGSPGALAAAVDLTTTLVEPGFRDDRTYRFATQLSHRTALGGVVLPAHAAAGGPDGPGTGAEAVAGRRLTLDTRLDLHQVYFDSPEDPEVAPGSSASNRDSGLRVSERARLALGPRSRLEWIASADYTRQRSRRQLPLLRGGIPFTDRLEEGRATGRFIGGSYIARVQTDGDVWQVFSQMEADLRRAWLGLDHRLRTGLVLRREWNSGEGLQFDIEFPPQSRFNAVQGFDRPRRYDEIPATATSAAYVDERVLGTVLGDVAYDLQAGVRLDVLHDGEHWVSGVRDAVLQPRVNAQLSPRPWLRLRAGAGRTAKQPSVGQLHPPPQYFDVVNVNWFAPDPAERLAVLTTFIRDPSNPALGFSTASKLEVGLEVATTGGGASLTLTGFRDRIRGGIGFRSEPGFIFRDRYTLSDSTIGTGRPPGILEPPHARDSIPILLDVPANNLTLATKGWELTARLPELRPLRTRLEVQGAWIDTDFSKDGLDFGTRFSDFQLDERMPRAPYWQAVRQTGERALLTYRLIHHHPGLGLVVAGTVQHFLGERLQNVAGTDTLAFEGYITRGGGLVPVPLELRGLPEFADLRVPRLNTFVNRNRLHSDWFLSLQVSLDMPAGGRLSFYGFNLLDRRGKQGTATRVSRFFPALRFGLEGSLPLGWAAGGAR